MKAIAITQGFRVTIKQFDQLASAEQLAIFIYKHTLKVVVSFE